MRALVLCPENSEPNLARATGDMDPERSTDKGVYMMTSGKASQKRWHLRWILKDELALARWRMTFQGGEGAELSIVMQRMFYIHCCGCGVGQQLQLGFDPSLRTLNAMGAALKRGKKNKTILYKARS